MMYFQMLTRHVYSGVAVDETYFVKADTIPEAHEKLVNTITDRAKDTRSPNPSIFVSKVKIVDMNVIH